MNKADLVRTIANDCQISRAEASNVLNCLLDVVTKVLARGEDIDVAGFGTLALRRRRACGGRNPQTGAPLIIPAANTPFFTPSQALRDELSQELNDQRASETETGLETDRILSATTGRKVVLHVT